MTPYKFKPLSDGKGLFVGSLQESDIETRANLIRDILEFASRVVVNFVFLDGVDREKDYFNILIVDKSDNGCELCTSDAIETRIIQPNDNKVSMDNLKDFLAELSTEELISTLTIFSSYTNQFHQEN